jgi:sec-independent protein translocase protein TatA
MTMIPLAFIMGPSEIAVVVLVIVVLFGAKKIPELGKSLAEGIREFKKALKDNSEDEKPIDTEKKE